MKEGKFRGLTVGLPQRRGPEFLAGGDGGGGVFSVTPGSVTPGSVTPGSVTPGSVTPGSVTPGGAAPGS
ncbi:MAG: hypothetical protein WC058_13875 [Phycisphaeraceae bacterium]